MTDWIAPPGERERTSPRRRYRSRRSGRRRTRTGPSVSRWRAGGSAGPAWRRMPPAAARTRFLPAAATARRESGHRQRPVSFPAPLARGLRIDHDERGRIAADRSAKEQAVEHGKDDRVQANAEDESQDNRDGELRRTARDSQCIAEILSKEVELTCRDSGHGCRRGNEDELNRHEDVAVNRGYEPFEYISRFAKRPPGTTRSSSTISLPCSNA